MSLRDYARKRRFGHTPEPADDAAARGRTPDAHRPTFVVQLHAARARHYDFRLEVDGALKSWAVPKGPSLRAGEKRLAVQVEDHPLAYGAFEGEIPEGNYGAGHVLVFDHGTWRCAGDPLEAIAAGKLDFVLEGGKLRGGFKLIRTGRPGAAARGGKPQWLLVKRDDAHARDAEADDLVDAEPGPASSARRGRTWTPGEGEHGARTAAARSAPPASRPRGRPRSARGHATWHARAAALPDARDRPLPAGFKPELATLRQHAPEGDDWLHEVKWDGYRLLVDLVDGRAALRSRNGVAWTADFPTLAAAIEALPVGDARLDGELVALDARGDSDFALLQRVLGGTSTAALRYVVFDLPGVAGVDLSRTPLLARKQLLERLLAGADPLLAYSSHVLGHGGEVFAASGTRGLEGIVSKRIDAPYTQSRSTQWIKTKHAQGDEFAVVGYSAPKGARTGFGALLLATPDGDAGWRYVGRVGTGYSDATLAALLARLQPLRRKTAPVALPEHLPHDKRDRGDITWVRPHLVAQVAYRGWGKDGLLRQASFQRLRTDKTVEDLPMPTRDASGSRARPARKAKAARAPAVTRPAQTAANKPLGRQPKPGTTSPASQARGTARAVAAAPKRQARTPPVQVTSRDRVVFASAGITKGEVADYYAAVADWILPGITDRPLSLLRCPGGTAGECFFQKHHADALGTHVRTKPIDTASGTRDYLYVRDAAGLLDLVQMNTLEFHPWGAKVDRPEHPDTLVFDLDPGPGVSWKAVVAAARDVRARLRDASLESFVRLSGGKGVHVVAPIRRGPTWDQAKDFCGAFAQAMAAHAPMSYVANMAKAQRTGRIFIDWLRNGRGATSVCSWSLRARDGAPVAMPVRWEDLARMPGPDAFDLRKAIKRAKALKSDPWDGYARVRQSLPRFD